jgi:hypothetical protein
MELDLEAVQVRLVVLVLSLFAMPTRLQSHFQRQQLLHRLDLR